MLKIQTLAPLLILTIVSPQISAQTSNDINFGARVRALHMAEKALRDLNMRSSEYEIFPARLEELERNIKLFNASKKELLAFLSLDIRSRPEREAIERKSKALERIVDQLMSFVGGRADDSPRDPPPETMPEIVDELSKNIIRVLPRLEQLLQMGKKNLIDVNIQQQITQDLNAVKALSRQLRD